MDVTDLQLPNGVVACHISVSASYVGVYSKKAKFTKAIYLHGMVDEPTLDSDTFTVTLAAGGLRFVWSAFTLPADAMRLSETLHTFMNLGNHSNIATDGDLADDDDDESRRRRARQMAGFSLDDWTRIVSVCDGSTRAYEQHTIILQQGQRSDNLYLVEQGRLTVMHQIGRASCRERV